MRLTLTDGDIDAIASRVVEIIGARLSAEAPRPAPAPQLPAPPSPEKRIKQKLAYTLKELSEELGISKITLYRMEARGLLKSLPYFRHKVFSHEEVTRFLAGKGGDPMSRVPLSPGKKQT